MRSVTKISFLLGLLPFGFAPGFAAEDSSQIEVKVAAAEQERYEIIGGEQALPGQWPATVALVSNNEFSLFRRQFCAGSLVSETWVITAAHCLFDTRAVLLAASSFKVATQVTDLDDEDSANEIAVKSIVVHPFYDAEDLNGGSAHDIALIELAVPSITPTMAFYNGDPESAVGSIVTVVGWGATSYEVGQQPTFPTILNQLNIPLVSRQVCNEPQSYNGLLGAGQICAGYAAGGVDACVGDSGGPLMFLQNGGYRQIGVVSFGRGCAEENQYGVYTSVPFYAGWINQYISGEILPGQEAPGSVLPTEAETDARENEQGPSEQPNVSVGFVDPLLLIVMVLIAGIYAFGFRLSQKAKVFGQLITPVRK